MRIMKTNSFSRKISHNKGNIISSQLATKTINKIATICGYIQRKTGKITPKSLIIGFMIMVSKKCNTYTDWAMEIGNLEGQTISKQALHERMSPQTESFVKGMVEKIISKQTPQMPMQKIKGVLKHFKNVMIDDSTTIALPDILAEEFPGNVVRGEKKAQAKIHALYNLTGNNFIFLNVHSFRNNDQSLSSHILPYLQKGDLCLRDLGFTILEVISKFIDKGIYFIARKGYISKVFDVETGSELNLLKELRKKKIMDKEVMLGVQKQLKVRLIALPISPEQAAERRRKAIADRDKRHRHTSQYYELLGYSIYITNILPKHCSPQEIFQLYRLRWRIEIIFKSWKSCFSLEKLIHRQCKNAIRVNCIIYLMLLYIYLFQVVWWRQCEMKIEKKSAQIALLSILKMANFYNKHFIEIILTNTSEQIIKQIQTHCVYEKRKDRDNAKIFQIRLAA